MDNKNLNENPSGNGFSRAMKGFGGYLKGVGFDFVQSFKYNNMKLAGWLIAIPGLLIGFFLKNHYYVVSEMKFYYDTYDFSSENFDMISKSFLDFDFTGIVLLGIMLFGILNVFNSTSLMGKKNLGSVVTCTIFGSLMTICAGLYLFAIFYYKHLCDLGIDNNGLPNKFEFTSNYFWSIFSIVTCVVATIVGIVLAFINYDRTYEKVDR